MCLNPQNIGLTSPHYLVKPMFLAASEYRGIFISSDICCTLEMLKPLQLNEHSLRSMIIISYKYTTIYTIMYTTY